MTLILGRGGQQAKKLDLTVHCELLFTQGNVSWAKGLRGEVPDPECELRGHVAGTD